MEYGLRPAPDLIHLSVLGQMQCWISKPIWRELCMDIRKSDELPCYVMHKPFFALFDAHAWVEVGYLRESASVHGSLGSTTLVHTQIVEGLLSSCHAQLTYAEFAGEGALHKLLAGRLLRLLAHDPEVAATLFRSSIWQALAGENVAIFTLHLKF